MKLTSLTLLGLVALPVGIFAQSTDDYVPGQIVVKYRGESLSTLAKIAVRGTTQVRVPQISTEIISLPIGQDVAATLRTLKNDPNIVFAEPSFKRYLTNSNDPFLSQQYGLSQVKAFDAWNLTKGSSNAVVAVIDTGLRTTHEDILGKIAPGGYNFSERNENLADSNGHGTHCAGIVAATTNNALGVASAGYSARVLPLKIFPNATSANSAAAIIAAADRGARIISMSYGGPSRSQAEQDAVNYAWSKNCILFAAAGNEGSNDPAKIGFPAQHINVISVGATNASDQRASYSNFGPKVLLAGPGDRIASLGVQSDKQYVLMSGTSMATPFVASVAALIVGRNPQLSNQRIREILFSSADKVGDWVVNGRVNAFRAVQQMGTVQTLPIRSTLTEVSIPRIDNVIEGVNVQNLSAANMLSAVRANDSVLFNVGSVNRAAAGFIASVSGSLRLEAPTNLADLQTLGFTFTSRSMAGATAQVSFFNNKTGTWVRVATVAMGGNNLTTTVNITQAGFANYVATNGTVRFMVRNILPARTTPVSYTFAVNHAGLTGTFRSFAP
jgi:thermitase